MEKKEIKPGEPVTAAGVTVIPVMETTFNLIEVKHTLLCTGTGRAVHIIIKNGDETRAFTGEGAEVSPADLIREVPGLEKLVYSEQARQP
jgi:hypothetical protein